MSARKTISVDGRPDGEVLAELLSHARSVAQRAFAPYSRFRVGAALRDADGTTFVGCNVESASYGLTICAERAAIFNAISAGARKPFAALALACLDADSKGGCMPCGACRQVISEHLPQGARIAVDGGRDYAVGDLLPYAFTLAQP